MASVAAYGPDGLRLRRRDSYNACEYDLPARPSAVIIPATSVFHVMGNCPFLPQQTVSHKVFGVLNLNKPEGVTSRDVVNVVQRLIRPVKVGHAGTLDPLATGVLLVCVGRATRLISVLQAAPKTYRAAFLLGQTSDTDDSTGQIIRGPGDMPSPSRSLIESALRDFVGEIDQVPPQYSAVKVAGRRAYALARQGEQLELKPRKVMVHRIEIDDYSWPELKVTIECGSGTYIRSIGRDLGRKLGCGGLMTALQRTCIGEFSSDAGLSPDDLNEDRIKSSLVDPVSIVRGFSQYRCSDEEVLCLRRGRAFHLQEDRLSYQKSPTQQIALTSSDGCSLLALGEIRDSGVMQPRQVFCDTL